MTNQTPPNTEPSQDYEWLDEILGRIVAVAWSNGWNESTKEVVAEAKAIISAKLAEHLLETPESYMEYPKFESNCCGAPIYKLFEATQHQHVCLECRDWCIVRKKK